MLLHFSLSAALLFTSLPEGSERASLRPTVNAARIGLAPAPRSAWLVSPPQTAVPRRRISRSGSIAIGAFIGAFLGGSVYKFKRQGDNSRDTSPLLVLEYTLVGAAIGFMAAPSKH